MILLMTTAGFALATPRGVPMNVVLLLRALASVWLLWGGIAALNQWSERDLDGLMERTRARPLPSGRLSARVALGFGATLTIAGLTLLTFEVNVAAGALGAFVAISYLGVYTPLKTRSMAAAFWGAFPGAVPPLLGWVAAGGALDARALAPVVILFLWQFPHLNAIAWRNREGYARAGMRLSPAVAPEGMRWRTEVLLASALLFLAGWWPVAVGLSGSFYGAISSLLGGLYAAASVCFVLSPDDMSARCVVRASVLYLPLLFAVMLLNR